MSDMSDHNWMCTSFFRGVYCTAAARYSVSHTYTDTPPPHPVLFLAHVRVLSRALTSPPSLTDYLLLCFASRSLCSLSLFLSHARARLLSPFRFVNLTDFIGAKTTLETMVAAGVPADAVTYTAYMKMLVPMKRDVPIHFQEGTWNARVGVWDHVCVPGVG
jgi:hypothetical protein